MDLAQDPSDTDHVEPSPNAHTIEATPNVLARAASNIPTILLATYSVLWLALAISPVSRADWLLENLLVFICVPLLVTTRTRMPFSLTSYWCLFIFFGLHAIGSHYTYALVPYDRAWELLTGATLSDLLGWERNHFDRLVHFLYGVLMLPPAVELLDRYAPARAGWRWVMPVLFIASHSAIYETVEWIAALLVAPDLGAAYLGTQGDEWDAQKDMALAIAGAVLSVLVIALIRARKHVR